MLTRAFPVMDLETRKLARQIQKLKRDIAPLNTRMKKVERQTKDNKARLNTLSKKIKSRR